MLSRGALFGLLLALPRSSLQAREDFGICDKNNCEDCPFYANKNAGHPDCVIYHRDGLDGMDIELDDES